jgi:hypothetical protein
MAKRKAIRAKIRDQVWRVEFAHIGDFGHCEYGSCRRTRRIRLSPTQSDADLLDTVIHEMIHAQDWDLSEEAVTQRATEIATVLQRVFDVTRKPASPRGSARSSRS